ncbi:MAG TPA: CxxxxCH/CxxCH domain-containing protein [Kofleriaceae bacterium]|nr:CxxxxCH/CxxCH domain-containing protein [Kofleriaceae bacterium]
MSKLLLLLPFALVACSNERELAPAGELTTWKDDVAPLVAQQCASCHGGADPAAGYDLTTYLGALGKGDDDVANAIAGDASSKLLAKLDGDELDDLHAGFSGAVPVLRAWIIDSKLAYERTRVHDPTLLDPASARFHGADLQAAKWNFGVCQNCHGEDFSGGAAQRSCLGCHAKGPTACDTCHEAAPTTNAHPAHLARAGLQCSDCHVVPETWDAPGHILNDGVVDDAPAEVTLGALANRDVSPPRRTGPATYANGTCTNVYCHGALLGDPAAAMTSPAWTSGATAAACGACHGKPPANHIVKNECTACHPTTVTPQMTLTAAHIDGAIQVGDGGASCSSCHGDATSAAPPRGLHGETVTTQLAVGAHRAHLDGTSRLRGPIACNECHVVPATVDAGGHIDSELPAEVFPIGSGTLARADGATPSWDRMSATCSGSYCHGGGAKLQLDTTPGVRTPSWTAGSQVFCGSCHGVPPTTSPHTPAMTLGQCTTCHPSVDGFGNIILDGTPDAPTSLHLNGAVDVR